MNQTAAPIAFAGSTLRSHRHVCAFFTSAAEESRAMLPYMTDGLTQGERIDLRGFGSFTVRERPARTGRNPRTGAHVSVDKKSVPFFKTGKEMRERLNRPSP